MRRAPPFRRHIHRGFTLIELLLATTLSALLLGGVLVVSAALARDARRMATRPSSATPLDAAADLLARDLTNARSITRRDDGRQLVLIGHTGISPRTRAATNRLARVVYEIRPLDSAGRSTALVRRQEYLDDPIDRSPWQELVAVGVVAIDAVPADGSATEVLEPLATATMSPAPLGSPPPVTVSTPARVSMRIETADPSQSVVREVRTR